MMDYGRYGRLRFASILTTALLILLVAGVTTYQIYNSYVNTMANAQQKLLGYAKALDEHASRALGEAEKTLDIIVDRISPNRASMLNEKALHGIIKSEIAKLPQAAVAFIVDRKGTFKAFSEELPTKRLDVSDRDYFINLRDDPQADIYISRAFRNRSNDMWRFRIAKRIHDKKGAFDGIVAIAFKPEYFDYFYKSMNIGASTRINLMRTDGYTLIVSPSNDASYEQNFSNRDLFKKYLPTTSQGFYRAPKFGYDLSDRIAAYSKLSSFPALALVSLQTDEILSEWKSQAARQASVTAVVLLVFVLTSVLLTRQLKKLEESERKLSEHASMLRESQKIAKLGNWDLDLVSQVLSWSDETYRLFDRSAENFVPSFNEFARLVHPNDLDMMQTNFDNALKSESSPYHVTVRIINDTGREWVMEAFGVVRRDTSGKALSIVGTAQDITERKQAEEKIRQSEIKYRNLFDSSTDAIFILDLNGLFIDANRTAYERLGYTREEMLALHISKLTPPELAQRVPERIAQIREHGAAVFESAHLRKDGTAMPVEVNARLIEYEGKTVLFSVIRDITERKQAEEQIRQSEQFIRGILDTVDEGFIVINRDYRILTANKAYCNQVGGCDETIIGRHCYEVSHKINRPCYEEGEDCATRQAFETGTPHSALHRHKDASDNILYVESKAFPIKDSNGAITFVIETINDITERHLLEEERLKSQKLESIGTLAGGIAHDFNNLLQGVFGYISLAKMTVSNPEKSTAALEQAEKALHLSVNLTTQLLTFSKGGKPVRKPVNLRLVIENATRFALSGSRSESNIAADDNLWWADADEGQIGQVIQNIILNADQAMPVGGRIEIRARNVQAPSKNLPPALEKGNYVEVSIADNGIGIQAEYLSRIFDPYFTTKEKGSGLGLATSYSIIRNHNGLINVKSELGKGTIFTIYLPATVAAGREKHIKQPLLSKAEHTGRILIMDDEQVIRDVAGALITALGHEVEFAKQGEEAIEKYETALKERRPFDVVILDLTIRGGMGGLETLQQLLKKDPDVKAVVSSGYSDNAASATYEKQGFKAFLKKPYDVNALREVLNRMLNT